MKSKCRILSIIVVLVSIITTIVCAIIIANKNSNEPIYATSINFVGQVKGAELLIGNQIVLNESLISVEPINCTVKPEFTIKRYNAPSDSAIVLSEPTYSVEDAGSYIVSARIKANENYYLSDSVTIKFVSSPGDTTTMYIYPYETISVFVEDSVALESLVDIVAPNSAQISFECNQNITILNNIITAITPGVGAVNIMIAYDNFIILETVNMIIKPKVIASEIGLILTVGPNQLSTYVVEITNSSYTFTINYQLLNIENQLINCWTDSKILQVVSYNAPSIVINTIECGNAILYISPVEYDNIIFEILIKIT